MGNMDGILFIYFTLPLLALFLCLIARIINKLCLKKRRILAEYDKKGRELMKQRIVTDRALYKNMAYLKVILLHIMVLQYKYTRS